MSENTLDLDAYFDRIGYKGPRTPSYESLRAVHRAHATGVSFENLDVLAGQNIALDGAALHDKIVAKRRGGYCFEQNGLLLRVLRQMGFDVTGMIGRVRWMQPEQVATPLNHMLIRVDLPEGPYLADVGFGGYRMTEPIRLRADIEQDTAHGRFRLKERGVELDLQADLAGNWVTVYRFTLQPQAQVDYELSSWYTSTHPESLFVNNLLVERPDDEARYMLFNNVLTVRAPGSEPEIRHLVSAAEMEAVLRDYFGLAVRSDQERALLEKIAAMPVPRPAA